MKNSWILSNVTTQSLCGIMASGYRVYRNTKNCGRALCIWRLYIRYIIICPKYNRLGLLKVG